MKTGKHFAQDELDYIVRVAGKVSLPVISKSLKRTDKSIIHKAWQLGVKLQVPEAVLRRHWPEYVRGDDGEE